MRYTCVVLTDSFEWYQKRYHLIDCPPTLVICYEHNTVLPVCVLSMRTGRFAQPYDLPEQITNIEKQRATKIGARVLLGMYISGMRLAQTLVADLPPTSRKRYLAKAKALSKRERGRPVGLAS